MIEKTLLEGICYTAVFSVVTQRSSTQREERYVTTLKTVVQQTRGHTTQWNLENKR